jgi:hypothetical protein
MRWLKDQFYRCTIATIHSKEFKSNQDFLGEDDDKSLKKNNRIEAIISKKKLNLTLGFRTYCNCRDIN